MVWVSQRLIISDYLRTPTPLFAYDKISNIQWLPVDLIEAKFFYIHLVLWEIFRLWGMNFHLAAIEYRLICLDFQFFFLFQFWDWLRYWYIDWAQFVRYMSWRNYFIFRINLRLMMDSLTDANASFSRLWFWFFNQPTITK